MLASLQAPAATLADDVKIAFGELIDPVGQFAEWDENRTGDVGLGVFLNLANVDHGGQRCQPDCELLDVDLLYFSHGQTLLERNTEVVGIDHC